MTLVHRDYTTKELVSEYVGATFCDREENYHDDSDGYSHVWDGERVIRVGTWTTRFGHSHVSATVDAEASPAIIDWHIRAIAVILVQRNKRTNWQMLTEAFTPAKGDYVRVARGRKVPVGTEGVVIWTGERNYSQWQAKYGKANLRVGIKDEAGNVYWTDASNVDMVDEPVYALVSEKQEDMERRVRESFEAGGSNMTALHREWCRMSSSLTYYI